MRAASLLSSLLCLSACASAPGTSEDEGRPFPAQNDPYRGRIARDGRAFVARSDGKHFLWRGVSEFLLGWYLFDPSRAEAEREALVRGRIEHRARQGYTVLRVFGMADWSESGSPVRFRPLDDYDRYKAAMRRLLDLARERGMYVEWVLFTDVGKTFPRERAEEHVDWAAQEARDHDNTFVEIVNEGFKNGLSRDDIYRLGRRFKERAGEVLLAGSSPEDESAAYGEDPFDYITLHSERQDGDEGWRWVRHLREGEMVSGEVNRPLVQDEPIGSAAAFQPGRRDSSAQRFRAAALVCHATRQYFTFHNECAVQSSRSPTCSDVPTPGADQVWKSDLIPPDPRDGRFINGHWRESPFEIGAELDSGALLRLYTKMKHDGTGFVSYPLRVKADLAMRLRSATRLVVVDVDSRSVLSDRDYASGEALRLPAGSDVVIYGGAIDRPSPAPRPEDPPSEPPRDPPQDPPPPPPPIEEKVPEQLTITPEQPVRTYTDEQATTIVHRLYRAVFARDADPSGMGSYRPLVASGQLGRVASILVRSAEWEGRRPGLTVSGLATDMYQAILGRAPDPGGFTGTRDAIRAGRLAHRLTEMFISPEYSANRL